MEAKEIKDVEEEYDESERALWQQSLGMLAHRYLTCRAKAFQWLKGRVKRQKFEAGL